MWKTKLQVPINFWTQQVCKRESDETNHFGSPWENEV